MKTAAKLRCRRPNPAGSGTAHLRVRAAPGQAVLPRCRSFGNMLFSFSPEFPSQAWN